MSYFIHNAVLGNDADKPDPANTTGGAIDPAYPLYIAGDTGKIYQSTGKSWVQIAAISGGGGSITDATTSAIGGVEVDHARSGAHSVALTTDGLALPAGMIGATSSKAAAGNDGRLSDARTPTAHAATHVGAGGDVVYPGVTADGLTPAGLTVAGGVTAAGGSFAVDQNGMIGDAVTVAQAPGDNSLTVLNSNTDSIAIFGDDKSVTFRGAIHGDTTAAFTGGIGRFGHAVPGAASSITGALSAVTDPAAKAVLTALVAAALADGGATDNTT